jgi:nucleoside-diphosphate-sugar epimerase
MALPRLSRGRLRSLLAVDLLFGLSPAHLGVLRGAGPAQLIRVAADLALITAALAAAFLLRFLWGIAFEEIEVSPSADLKKQVDYFTGTFWILALIALPIFVLSGFYTYGRAYRSRYKALVLAQAVVVAYLVLGTLAFLFPRMVDFPRSIVAVGCALTIAVLWLSRFWTSLWRRVIALDDRDAPRLAVRHPETVLLIGGAGYIGSALLPKLLDDGKRVRIYDLFLYGQGPIERFLGHPGVELVHADFRQVDALVKAMRGVDQVVHLGGIVGDPACALDEELTIDVNLTATRVIAEVAKGHGVGRFLFASTCSVYGASDDLLDERSMLNPVSLYARSKIASERVLLGMADEAFIPIIVRFGTIFGLSGRTRFDVVVNLLTAKALFDGEITVYGGDQWRPFVHVDDAALAVSQLMRQHLHRGDEPVFNVGSDEGNHTIQDIARMVQARVPAARLLDLGRDGDRRHYRVRFDRLAAATGFRPSWSVAAGIDQVALAIEAGAVTDWRDSRYSNVKFLHEDAGSRLVRRRPDWAHELIRTADGHLPAALAEPR